MVTAATWRRVRSSLAATGRFHRGFNRRFRARHTGAASGFRRSLTRGRHAWGHFRRLARGVPARARFGRRTFNRNKAIAKFTNNLSETKLLPTTVYNELPSIPIQLGAIATYVGFVMNDIPSGWDSSLNKLGGIGMGQGLTGSQRIGNYVYLKKTHLNLQVDINETSQSYQPPNEYRLLVVKQRGSVIPAGLTDTPQTSLFLNTIGAPQGYTTGGFNGMDCMLAPVNKRDWVVFRDQKFTLSTPSTAGGGMNYKYPSRKNLMINLPYWAKTRYHPTTNLPEDLDTHYLVYLFASAIGKDRSSNNWEVTTRGTTSYSDN